MITQILIMPSCGFSNDDGFYEFGYMHKNVTESDIVYRLAESLEEEFYREKITCRVMNTRKHPGIPIKERVKHCDPNSLVLHLGCGWHDKPRADGTFFGSTTTYYGNADEIEIAHIVNDAAGEWGKCTVYEHQKSKPKLDKKDPILTKKDIIGIKLEPFQINTPSLEDYFLGIQRLGRDIGQAVALWCKDNGFAQFGVQLKKDKEKVKFEEINDDVYKLVLRNDAGTKKAGVSG